MATDIAVVKKLEPCPFCGGINSPKIFAFDGEPYVPGFVVRCDASGFDGMKDRGCGVESGWGETPDEAATAWNRRALSQDYLDLKASHDAAVAALRDAAQSAGFQYMLAETRDRIDAALAKAAALTTPAAPVAADDGWIAWEGGECPVAGDIPVTVRLSSGGEFSNVAGFFALGLDWWKHMEGGEYNIVAYRAYRPAAGGAL